MRAIKIPVTWTPASVVALTPSWARSWMGIYRRYAGSPGRIRSFHPEAIVIGVVAVTVVFWYTNTGPLPRVKSAISADEFAQAVAQHRTSLIDLYLHDGLDPNARGAQERPILVSAALERDWVTFRRLLRAGASPDLADDEGTTPLMVAAKTGNVDILRDLVGIVTSVDATDRSGRSALHYAIEGRQNDAVDFLLPFVPDLETHGSDLLAAGLDSGDLKIANALLERITSLQEWSPAARRVLEKSLASGDHEQARILMKKHAVPPTPEGSNVPTLAHAIARKDSALFDTLLLCGADPNTLLPSRCDKEFLDLLKNKYLRNYIDGDTDITVLMLAAGVGQTEYVQALLAAGADRNKASARYKMRPLYLAAQSGFWRSAQLLLGGGPSPDQLRIEISLASQKVALIKDGVTVFNTTCSTGMGGRYATRAGDYVITDKDRYHVSTIYKVQMPYFMRLSCLDFGMHEGYVPNYPASHGCIRLPGDAARKFFAELPVGTLVSVK